MNKIFSKIYDICIWVGFVGFILTIVGLLYEPIQTIASTTFMIGIVAFISKVMLEMAFHKCPECPNCSEKKQI